MAIASNEIEEVRALLSRDRALTSAWNREQKVQDELTARREKFLGTLYVGPQSIQQEIFAPLVLSAAKASGVERGGENMRAYLARALRGKTVGVIGTRYGLLQKTFELFGAKTYGIDIDRAAVGRTRKEGLEAAHGSAEEMDRLFPGKRPDFLVSFQFFDPGYWGKKRDKLLGIQTGILRHSTNATVQIHGTIGTPTDFPGAAVISSEKFKLITVTMLKKGIGRRQVS